MDGWVGIDVFGLYAFTIGFVRAEIALTIGSYIAPPLCCL